MSAADQVTFSVDWERLLAEDGSLPYVFPSAVAPSEEAPKPVKRSAVAPRPRDPGVLVSESDTGDILGIVDCLVAVETRWRCPKCGVSYKKPGRHVGALKTCRTAGCGVKFFLRGGAPLG